MNEEELRKALSAATSAPVPKGYWESYRARLEPRLVRAHRPDESPRTFVWAIPTFALSMALLGGVFWLGRQSAQKTVLRIPGVHLASYEDDARAKHVFQEMLQLFPNRVNCRIYLCEWKSGVQHQLDGLSGERAAGSLRGDDCPAERRI